MQPTRQAKRKAVDDDDVVSVGRPRLDVFPEWYVYADEFTRVLGTSTSESAFVDNLARLYGVPELIPGADFETFVQVMDHRFTLSELNTLCDGLLFMRLLKYGQVLSEFQIICRRVWDRVVRPSIIMVGQGNLSPAFRVELLCPESGGPVGIVRTYQMWTLCRMMLFPDYSRTRGRSCVVFGSDLTIVQGPRPLHLWCMKMLFDFHAGEVRIVGGDHGLFSSEVLGLRVVNGPDGSGFSQDDLDKWLFELANVKLYRCVPPGVIPHSIRKTSCLPEGRTRTAARKPLFIVLHDDKLGRLSRLLRIFETNPDRASLTLDVDTLQNCSVSGCFRVFEMSFDALQDCPLPFARTPKESIRALISNYMDTKATYTIKERVEKVFGFGYNGGQARGPASFVVAEVEGTEGIPKWDTLHKFPIVHMERWHLPWFEKSKLYDAYDLSVYQKTHRRHLRMFCRGLTFPVRDGCTREARAVVETLNSFGGEMFVKFIVNCVAKYVYYIYD